MVAPPDEFAASDRDALAADLAALFGHDLADQPPVTLLQLGAMRRFDATPRLHEMSGIATLVVSAAQDRIARPEFGRALADGIPGSLYVEIADASHGVTIRNANRVNALLLDHLKVAEQQKPEE